MAEPLILDPPPAGAASSPAGRVAAPGTFVTFELSGQTFGVSVGHVREILDRQEVARLPNASPGCAGLIDTRGESIPLIDLAERLAMAAGEPGADTRIIVFEVQIDGAARPIGVLADRVLNVAQIAAEAIEPTPRAAVIEGSARGLRGLARVEGRLVVLLDVAELFGAEPMLAL
ncbi:chemotaxis protein CheW [Paralimibaculum aggregatum]|uniref:Chemotaxis protein CheW n=1 Tax=Paralimibaculum aggregatum TaxID=3036245 RepID=A0ABQ6LKG8_9RHOB|nr:chemotaxis protein CheW [Limibaculum sp. NKW23]GMG83745.1 chemotaxis protein CheW [Limibaculum sp. NKW23]